MKLFLSYLTSLGYLYTGSKNRLRWTKGELNFASAAHLPKRSLKRVDQRDNTKARWPSFQPVCWPG